MSTKAFHTQAARSIWPHPVPRLSNATKLVVATLAGSMMAGCSGPLPFMNTQQEEQGAADRAAYAAPSTKPKQGRVRSQDILSEWGTFGLSPRPGPIMRQNNQARMRTLPEPDYSTPVREIMANAACRSCDGKPYHHIVMQASSTHGVPPALIHAVIQKESRYNPAATSKKRARGLMQVTPGTGKFVGVANSQTLYDPRTNINAGTAYLKYLMRSHDTVDEVLAAYNAGPGNVRKYNGVPPFNETRRYVHDVKKFYAATSGEVKVATDAEASH